MNTIYGPSFLCRIPGFGRRGRDTSGAREERCTPKRTFRTGGSIAGRCPTPVRMTRRSSPSLRIRTFLRVQYPLTAGNSDRHGISRLRTRCGSRGRSAGSPGAAGNSGRPGRCRPRHRRGSEGNSTHNRFCRARCSPASRGAGSQAPLGGRRNACRRFNRDDAGRRQRDAGLVGADVRLRSSSQARS